MTHLVTAAPRAPFALRRPAWFATVGRTIGTGLDGLMAGMVVGYVGLTTIAAPAQHLGIPPLVAIPVVGLIAVTVTLAGAALGMGIAMGCAWVGRRVVAISGRRAPRVAAVVAWPFRTVGGLPGGWIGALLVLVWIAAAGRLVAPLGFLVPPAMLSTFIYLGAVVTALAAMAWSLRPTHGRAATAVATVAAGLGVVTVAYALWPGPTAHMVVADPVYAGPAVRTALVDPGAPGPYAIETYSYGSGFDARRPAFGSGADLITPTVDASGVLRPLGNGSDAARSWWWGFGTDALPLDGLVWAPAGRGPFPVVLVVHGNHAMGDFSEDGYAYLGEHLASRGFVTASVDEDFLNGSWAGDWGGDEQVVRAWMLLLHLDQWRAWNEDPASPFHGRIDLERVALIGHSRGGEAASVAAMLADTAVPPRAGMEPWPTGLDIDAVISIAPSDGQYGSPVVLDGVDFLTLQGGHDADARAWSGIRQFARTAVGVNGFKAAVWSYGANHGRFNSVWDGDDQGPFSSAQLDVAPLLDAAAQQDLARTAIGAFLEASLHDHVGYRGLFVRPTIGRDWLPADDIVLVRSVDGRATPLTSGRPDRPIDGLTLTTDGFTSAGAMTLPLRALQPDQGARAAVVRWVADGPDPTWTLAGIDALDLPITPTSTLRFAIADGREPGDGGLAPLALSIEVADVDGAVVALPLDAVGTLPPPLPTRLAKHDVLVALTTVDLSLRSPVERVLQTYAIALSTFTDLDAGFTPSDLDAVRLRIGRTGPGVLWIADVGIAP